MAVNDHQPAIADYALLADGHGAALVSRWGSVDWACLPRFDSPSTFARILDEEAGRWRIAPVEPFEVERSYLPGTLVLRTVFRTPSGAVALTDALPFLPREPGHGIGERPAHTITRLAEGLEGEVELESVADPKPEYGLTVARWHPCDGGARARGGPIASTLSAPGPLTFDGGTARSRHTVHAGARLGFALEVSDPWASPPPTWSTERVGEWIDGTLHGWSSWSSLHQRYEGPRADLVHHSGRVLRALTYAPTGAVVAAPTTSLPEEIGGERNWDYRFTWVRDASLTLASLWVAACPDEIARFFEFFVTAAGGRRDGGDPLQILYSITGERHVPERELDHLGGHRGSRPVRIGNGAWAQSQLDVYGELLDAAALYADRIRGLDEAEAEFLADMADRAAERWTETDHGIWETRGPAKHFLSSKLMCWVALDRAIDLAEDLRAHDRVPRWERERGRVRGAILEEGWSDTAKAFTQAFGADDLDASALMIPIVGFLPADDPRVRSTIDAIAEHLTDEAGLVHRYRAEDGLPGGEASFGVCTFWLVHALALAGDIEAARGRFEQLAGLANDVGLLSEEIDGATGELLGNFPQAFTHIGLVNAAQAITVAEAAAGTGGRPGSPSRPTSPRCPGDG